MLLRNTVRSMPLARTASATFRPIASDAAMGSSAPWSVGSSQNTGCGVPDVIRVGLVTLADVDAFAGLRVDPGRISQQQDRTDPGLEQ